MISGASGAETKKLGTRPKRLATSRWNALDWPGGTVIWRFFEVDGDGQASHAPRPYHDDLAV